MSTDAPPRGVPSDPRLSARRAAVAREAGQRRLGILGVCAVVLALFVTGIVVAHSSVFAARHVVVLGAEHTSTAAIVTAGGLRSHPPLLDVGAANARAIERLPWIATARISRGFPDTVTVHVTERSAIAVEHPSAATTALIDRSGRVLEVGHLRASETTGLVTLGGLGRLPSPGHACVGEGLAVVRAAAGLPAGLHPAVTSVTYESGLGVVVHLRTGARAELGTASELSGKYLALATLLAHGALDDPVLADLRVPSSPVLNP